MSFTSGDEGFFRVDQDRFDFNIQFEQLFFSIIPSALFIVSSVWRTVSQARKPPVVNAPVFRLIKLSTITIYAGLEFSLLILVTIGSLYATSIFITSLVLKFVSALFMMILSFVDHTKSPRPSMLLNSYLFLTLLLDAAQARTLFLSSDDKPEITYSSIFCAAIALKVGILLLEAKRKSPWVIWNEKEHSPEETSGIFSLGVFFWLNKMFMDGYKKVLTIEDLYPLDISLTGTSLHEKFSKNTDYSKLKDDNYGLVKGLTKTLKVSLLLPIPPRLALLGFTFAQPFFIEALLSHLSKPELDLNDGYGLIGASIFIYAGIAISTALYWYFHNRTRTMARSILVTETFKKATEAKIGSSDESAALTLMSTDIERINMGFTDLHEVWACIIQVSLAAWMLYIQLGVVFVAAIGIVVVCFGGLGILMKFTGDSQRSWMLGVQKRVGLTATVIASMKNLKISGLSSALSDFVQQLRVDELRAGARFRKISIITALFGFTPMLLGPPLTLAFAQRTLDTTRIFTSLSWILLLTNPLSQFFQAVPYLLSGLACLRRIQDFLECDSRHDFREVLVDRAQNSEKFTKNTQALSESLDSVDPVVIRNGNFGWEADQSVLRDVNIRIVKSSLTVVIGAVGSGKSTLCKALLGEIPFSGGNVILSTKFSHIGFCEQTAFLSNESIRDNIVGFSPFNNERYAEVINATALSFDFENLPQADNTIVGSDGITLSGGQKQRVSLARALYLRSDLLVLDDVFSGLDAATEEQVFRQVFGPNGLLRRRRSTVIVCTHSVRHLPAADHIIALGDGSVVEQGRFETLITSQGYVQRLGELRSWNDSEASSIDTPMSETAVQESKFHATAANTASIVSNNDESRQLGDTTVYKHYFASMGWFVAASSLFFATLWGFFTNFPTIWLTYWSNDVHSDHPVHSYAYYATIYALLQICGMISLLLLGITLFIVSVKRAGSELHQTALRTLIRAPLRFFTATDTGVIVNLFSQDLNLIDTELPNALLNTLFCVFQSIGGAAVIVTSSPYIAISYPFIVILLYIVQKFYLRTSRQLRLLDLEAKSPLYSHFLDTVRGITTLRAFGFIPNDIQKNARLIDSSQRPAYLLAMIQQWLNFVLGIVAMIMAAAVTTLSVQLHSSSGFAGASLVTLMGLGENLSGIVISYTRLETSIGAIARLKTFNENVKPEDRDEEDIVPSEQWPQSGLIELKGVSASYDPEGQPGSTTNLALRNIVLMIDSGEKVSICGRTGSGKSSLIALLLKLLDPISTTACNAVIDNTPLHRINRTVLRERIIAVPQEAVFLPDGSTFQANLDPFNVSTPEECQNVLEAVDLWQFVQERGGLDAGMSSGNLSAGQRQLMSLGRALLKRRIRMRNLAGAGSEGGLLLLDEVSSSVDQDTERVMQDIIKVEFKNYTIVAVSHRLDMIMDFDRVVVMDMGEIVEIGNPMTLAVSEGSRFGDLVKAAAK